MRVIKFRVWDADRKKMYYLRENRFSFGTCEADRAVSWEDVFAEQHKELIPLQFTGLKDRNGKEIFEGNILKVPVDGNEDFHGTFSYQEVVNVNGQWVASYLKSEKGYKLPRGYTRGFLLDHFEYTPKLFLWSDEYEPQTEVEVVGNIYENPDLLAVIEG